VQDIKAASPIESTPSEMTTEFRFSQYSKAAPLIDMTDEGILTESKPLHDEKADSPMYETPSEIVTVLKLPQPLKAYFPKKVSVEGSFTEGRLVQ